MRGRLALAVLSGALTFAAFPGVGAWPLAFVSWAPLLLAIEGVSLRRAALLGFVAGLVATLPGFRFLYPTLRAQSGFGPVACALFVGCVAVYHALRGLVVGLVSRLDAPRARREKPRAVPPPPTPAQPPAPSPEPLPAESPPPTSASAPAVSSQPAPADAAPTSASAPPTSAGAPPTSAGAAPTSAGAPPASAGPPSVLFIAGLVASEIAVPSLFPWFFGASVHDVPLFLQSAELGGPVAVSVVLALSSLALAETLSALLVHRPTRPRVIVPALVIPIVAAFWGSLRIPEIDARTRAAPSLTAGIVQPNLPAVPEPVAVQRLRDASHELVGKGATLVVWPEGAVPWTLPAPLVEDAFAMLRAPSVPLLTGALVQGATPPVQVTNSALLFDAGRLVGRYDKHHLLPFSESLPFESTFPGLRTLSPYSGNFAAGTSLAPLPLRGHPMAVFICYEDLFPGHVRALNATGHAELLVNLTNDSWFSGTDELRVHLALAKLRAVEQRKYLVRATLTGKSAIVDPVGREIGTLGEDREATLLGEAHWLPGSTVYNRAGDVPWWLFVAGSLGYALSRNVRLRGAPRTRAPAPRP